MGILLRRNVRKRKERKEKATLLEKLPEGRERGGRVNH